MSEVTRILQAVEQGDGRAIDQLLPAVYQELRRLAAWRLTREKPGQTLQATALVHEAYLRLVGREDCAWRSKTHFFAAAAEAMRRILVENARRKGRQKRGGEHKRIELHEVCLAVDASPDGLIALDEALSRLAAKDPEAARLIELTCFGGLTLEQSAGVLGVSSRMAYRHWAFARAWLYEALAER